MRGKAWGIIHASTSLGITPAYAGKRPAIYFAFAFFWDHPRLCGEKLIHPTMCYPNQGSPPPMRGKAAISNCGARVIRITPAYAGKSASSVTKNPTGEDHPRLCGEKSIFRSASSVIGGSPPPMRGKGTPCKYPVRADRITPAYAGKSGQWFYYHCQRQDHPRLCGEKDSMSQPKSMNLGSPPPMRGKVLYGLPCYHHLKGSPPPMRGKAKHWQATQMHRRITPAYAGKRWVVVWQS